MSRAKTKERPQAEKTKTVLKKQPVSKKQAEQTQEKRSVLNVGGGSKETPIPLIYNDWNHVLLDIDPKGNPDVVCDARELATLKASSYDAIYCSHNLEHYYHFDALKVLQGFFHVVKDDGFVQIRVPDIQQLMRLVVEGNLDIDDFLYDSGWGPISVRDVIYGCENEIKKNGNDYCSHKTAFSPQSLQKIIQKAGFQSVYIVTGNLEVIALAFKKEPSEYAKKLLFNNNQ